MKTEPGIVIDSLSKQYAKSDKFALDELSLVVQPGEVYGFLGPNGAGKSTTIRLLMNFIQPTAGSASILGKDIIKDSVAIKKSVGYLSGEFAVYPRMTGRQYLSYLASLQPSIKDNLSGLTKRLKADLNKKMGELSRGNKQKIGIIQALMHQPPVLILDEPTTGLDPLMQEVFYELLAEAKQRGACIFVSSHILSEVQKMCDRVGIIREGRLISEQIIAEMADEAAQTFDITFSGTVPAEELKQVAGLKLASQKDNSVVIHMNGRLSDLFTVLAKYNVLKLDTRNLDLEEVFLHFYQNEESPK